MPVNSRPPVQAGRVTIGVLAVAAAAMWLAAQPGVLAVSWLSAAMAIGSVAALVAGFLRARSGGVACILVGIAFLGAWLITLRWIEAVSVAGWPALSVYSAVYTPLLGMAVRWTCRRTPNAPVVLSVVCFGLALEYVRAEVLFDAWPFHLRGHAVWGTPLALAARGGGVWACSLIVLALGGVMASVAIRRRDGWLLDCHLLWVGGLLVVTGIVWAPTRLDRSSAPPLPVLLVQTNLPQSNKMVWTREQQQRDVSAFLDMTAKGLRDADGTALVVWPETMVPGFGFEPSTLAMLDRLGESGAAWTRWPRQVASAAAASGVPWLVGSSTWIDIAVEDGYLVPERRFNSAVLLNPDGSRQRVDKVFLTPFGETMPYVRAWPWLEQQVLDFGAQGMSFNLDAAEETAQAKLPRGDGTPWSLAVPICFEDAVPSVVRGMCVIDGMVEVDAIVNLSNDGWFGPYDTGRQAHAVAAAFRAVELGRPLLRVANTGISSLILPDGRVAKSLPPDRAAAASVDVPAYEGTTVFAAWGNWLPRLSIILSAGWILWSVRLRTKGGTGPASAAASGLSSDS